ncbi:MAG: DoxX family protein [Ignavibacteria bacterium]|nr:DoxX family protein [Ignavibacteria bacterium]
MKLLFKARGSDSFGLLLIRLTIGWTFLIAGAYKVLDVETFISYVKSLEVMSDNLAFVLGFILPFAEVLFGAFYIIGIFTPLTSLSLSVMIISFIINNPKGSIVNEPYAIPTIVFYFIMLAATVTTLFSGAGIVSFDAIFDRKKANKEKEEPVIVPPPVSPPAGIEDIKTDNIAKDESVRDA